MDTRPVCAGRTSRRRLLALAAGGLLGASAGCLGGVGLGNSPTGTIRVRVRNTTNAAHDVEVRVFLDDARVFDGSVRLEASGSDPYTEQVWDAVREVPDGKSYRVVVVVDGERSEKEDAADCIANGGDTRGYELVQVSIQDDGTKILTDDCSG
ncbi:MAG: hypothetical protein ABEJ22_07985 [Haloferacaceae archaeon]